MVVKRIAACLLLLMLAGCYRQSEDNFGASSGQSQTTPLVPATDQPPIIDPTLDETPVSPSDATPTVVIIMPTDEEQPTESGAPSLENPTATIVIFEVPTKAAPTEEDNLFSDMPTATVPSAVITPILGSPDQVTLSAPSSTPSTSLVAATPGGSDLAPTPTDLPTELAGECDYTIVGGDTLFRIALRNNVLLQDLLVANDLSESSIIQPGQVITIPDCVPEGSPETIIPTATPGADIFLPTPTGVSVSNGTPGTSNTGTGEIYTVKAGDSLSVIAAQFGVTVKALTDANNLVDPNRLSIGQKLTIPK
jgi:LysM repeat protein